MRPKEYARTANSIAYLPGFSAPRGRRCLSRSVRLGIGAVPTEMTAEQIVMGHLDPVSAVRS